MMLSATINKDLALIGAGYWGKNLARNFNALGALHTLCDANQATLDTYGDDYSGVKKILDHSEVLSDPAISRVAIAAPATVHFNLIKSFLEAGKDVFVEKPLCLDAAEGKRLVELAENSSKILMVGHLLHYHPCVTKLKELIQEGVLGKLQYITSNRLNLGKIRKEENALWSFAPHDISVILSLVGDQLPSSVICTGESYISRGVADTTLTNLAFRDGLRAHIYVSWLNPFKEQKLTVVGSKGMVVFDDTRAWSEKLLIHRDYMTWSKGQDPMPRKSEGEFIEVPESEPLRAECSHFLNCCISRQTPRTDSKEGLRVLKVLESAQKSMDLDGQPVAFNQRNSHTDGGIPDEDSVNEKDFYSHPSAFVDEGANIGKGTKIWHFGHVMGGASIGKNCVLGQNVNVDSGAVIGDHVKIQNNVSIYSGIKIENDVFLGPSCVLTNVKNPRSQVNRHSIYEKTVIKKGATIGANATIVCGVSIGKYAFVAAGAVVTKDVADYALLVGNPGKKVGWMSRHGHILEKPDGDGFLVCPESGFRYVEDSLGALSCHDLSENSPLPNKLKTGQYSYGHYKSADVS